MKTKQNQYWSTLPISRMGKLMTAVFCSLGSIGFFVDAAAWGRFTVLQALFWVCFSGIFAAGTLLLASRRPRLLFLWIPAGSLLILMAAGRMNQQSPLAPPLPSGAHNRMLFDTGGLMLCSIFSYSLFLTFANSEGFEHLRLATELSLAHDLQETLVPLVALQTKRYQVFGQTLPSDKVGGDLVDAIAVGDDFVGYLIDVSGHGIPAGTLMGMIKAAVRSTFQFCDGPASQFDLLNKMLPQVKQNNMYATACCFWSKGEDLTWSLAGHGPALKYTKLTGAVETLAMAQFPLGLLPSSYFEQSCTLAPGDFIVAVTDGVLEAEDKNGEEYGLDRLRLLLQEMSLLSPSDLTRTTLEAVARHSTSRADDQTVLIICRQDAQTA